MKLTGTFWKLGCNWGSGKPNFYYFVKEKRIVIGVKDKEYNIGDLILICEGHKVKALARVEENPIPVTNVPEFEEPFDEYQIDYDDWVYYVKAEWYELKENDIFEYNLDAGIRRVQKSEIKEKALQLWKNRNSTKINVQERFKEYLLNQKREGKFNNSSYDVLINNLDKLRDEYQKSFNYNVFEIELNREKIEESVQLIKKI